MLSSNIAIAHLCAAYSVGAEPYLDGDKILNLDDLYGEGADRFLRSLAAAWGDKVAFYNHDDPQCSLEGDRLVYPAKDFNVVSLPPTGGMQVIGFWTKDQYIDSCALFCLGAGAGVRKPVLKYAAGPDVQGEYFTDRAYHVRQSVWPGALAALVRDDEGEPPTDAQTRADVIRIANELNLTAYEASMLWSAAQGPIGY